MELQQHPIGKIFPPFPAKDFRNLANSVREHGLIEPIVLYEGQILDGYHRYQACLTENVEPRFVALGDGDDPLAYVMAKNDARRHLTIGDRKAVAKAILDAHPERTDRAVAKEAGISDKTVAAIRQEVEEPRPAAEAPNNAENPNNEADEPAEKLYVWESTGRHYNTAPPVERVESTGRRARGRKPAPRPEKIAKVKEAKPRPHAAREQAIASWTPLFKADTIQSLTDVAMIVKSYEGLIQQRCSQTQRDNCITLFAAALGRKVEISV